MTGTIRDAAIEAAARAIVIAEGGDPDARIDKGFVAQGAHVTTFSQIAWRDAEPAARAAIDAYERAMWRPEGEAAVDADYLVRDAGGLIRVAFLRDTGEWCDSASFARIVVRRFRALPFIVPQPQEDEA